MTTKRPRSRFPAAAGALALALAALGARLAAADETCPKKPASASKQRAGPATRAFRMGFTAFPHDFTLPAVAEARRFAREHGDIIAHHIEGVPWAECQKGLPFRDDLLADWRGKREGTPPGGRVYLAISPGRGDLKPAEKALPIPEELRGKPYDDPEVMRVYLAYCRRAIEFFRPQELAIGIEVNEIHSAGARKWAAYARLHRRVYRELRREHPKLRIFASFSLHNLFKKKGAMLEALEALMDVNDVVAVSYYPFLADRPAAEVLRWLTERFDHFGKPYAFVETNMAAERTPLPRLGLTIAGSETLQLDYTRRLLELAQKKRCLFVVNFIHRDYDALWEKIRAASPEVFGAWRDCGLLDESGRERPAYRVWQEWFEKPLRIARTPPAASDRPGPESEPPQN